MTKCFNCGHDSHCGNPLRKSVDGSAQEAGQIEVCRKCRCAQCDKSLSG